MARSIVDAAQHLHARSLMHGDLYAHNLLWNGQGGLWLGDFGAATLLPATLEPAQRQAFERLEVLAFGLLLQEWLARCEAAPDALIDLRDACLNADVASRPLFADLAERLGAG